MSIFNARFAGNTPMTGIGTERHVKF